MSVRNFRAFTIILVLELVAFESQVEAFAIQRTTDFPRLRDLDIAESTRLEVRNDLIRNVSSIEAKNISPPITLPIQTTAKTEEIQKNVTQSTKSSNYTTATTKEISSTSVRTKSEEESSSSVAPTKATTFGTNISSNTTSKIELISTAPVKEKVIKVAANTTKEINDYIENNNMLNVSDNVTSTERNLDPINNTVPVNNSNVAKNENNSKTHPNSSNSENVTYGVNSFKKVNATNLLNDIHTVNTTNEAKITNQDLQNLTSRYVNSSTTNTTKNNKIWKNNTESNDVMTTEESNATSYSTESVDLSLSNNVYKSSQRNIANNESNMNRPLPNDKELNLNEMLSRKSISAGEHKNTTEKLTGEPSGGTVTPYWKKYTTIERKRLNSTEGFVSTTSNEDLIQSGTAQSQTTISLEKALNIVSDIPSLEQLKNDLLAVNKMAFSTKDTNNKNLLFQENNVTESLEKVLENTPSTMEESNQAYNIVSSKRAGFLDFSIRPVINNEINTTVASLPELTSKQVIDDETNTTKPSTVDGTKTTGASFSVTSRPVIDNGLKTTKASFPQLSSRVPEYGTNKTEKTLTVTEVLSSYTSANSFPESKTTSPALQKQISMTSQSQLVEDAINEELLKEEIINDSVEIAKRVKEEGLVTTTVTVKSNEQFSTVSPVRDTSSEDKLRVKPISFDKSRSGSLYTVGPNYKPLKKIEVQPTKPFLRDPDDNSWRNESLSSLGIVFKANNSSKPFTQVLKNKTETEWNGLLERYNKGEEPELRSKLEKIAEMRKSKKKKTNSLGETVYTDYEETVSGENWNNSNTERSPFSGRENIRNFSSFFDEIEKLATTALYTLDDLRPTTMKTTTAKTMDDYEEDDEPDYTLPNIDLKKFITSTAAAPAASYEHPADPLKSPPFQLTILTNPRNRQPTLQYFPPRAKQQKVVINDYDTAFRNKINAFTNNNSPKVPPTTVTEKTPTFNFLKDKFEQQRKPNDIAKRPEQKEKNVYLTRPSSDQRFKEFSNQQQDPAGYNQAAYVIKHLRDFIDEVVKVDETPSSVTEEPLLGVTVNGMEPVNKLPPPSDYDYGTQFRKDVLSRFAENFNQNSERFKADYPILYNTSVKHSQPGVAGGERAESTAFMKRLYDDIRAFQQPKDLPKRYDPNCDRTVELSPAYELHYYVPEEEEKEEVEIKSARTLPHRIIRL